MKSSAEHAMRVLMPASSFHRSVPVPGRQSVSECYSSYMERYEKALMKIIVKK
jgi:hypothetical protein